MVACDNKKFKKITLDIFDEVKTLKIATTEKIDTIYFQYKIQGSPTLIHSKVDVKIIGYGSNNKSILMKYSIYHNSLLSNKKGNSNTRSSSSGNGFGSFGSGSNSSSQDFNR